MIKVTTIRFLLTCIQIPVVHVTCQNISNPEFVVARFRNTFIVNVKLDSIDESGHLGIRNVPVLHELAIAVEELSQQSEQVNILLCIEFGRKRVENRSFGLERGLTDRQEESWCDLEQEEERKQDMFQRMMDISDREVFSVVDRTRGDFQSEHESTIQEDDQRFPPFDNRFIETQHVSYRFDKPAKLEPKVFDSLLDEFRIFGRIQPKEAIIHVTVRRQSKLSCLGALEEGVAKQAIVWEGQVGLIAKELIVLPYNHALLLWKRKTVDISDEHMFRLHHRSVGLEGVKNAFLITRQLFFHVPKTNWLQTHRTGLDRDRSKVHRLQRFHGVGQGSDPFHDGAILVVVHSIEFGLIDLNEPLVLHSIGYSIALVEKENIFYLVGALSHLGTEKGEDN